MNATIKGRSAAPRLLRCQVERITHATNVSCFSSLPHRLFVITKLRGYGTRNRSFETTRLPQSRTTDIVLWDHEIYDFHLTEAEMFTRVLEFVVVQVNCMGVESIVGSAKLPLSEFEMTGDRTIHAKHLRLDHIEADLRLHINIDLWNENDEALAIENDVWEHERYAKGTWSKSNLKADDRAIYRSGDQTGNLLAQVVPPTPSGYIPSLGWAPDANGWFYSTSFAGPWHTTNTSYRCRRRRLVHRYRPATASSTAPEPSPLTPIGQSVAMADMSIEAILSKHKIALEDY